MIDVDSHTGERRDLIDEKTDTFIWTAHTENLDLQLVNWLQTTDEIIYVSERDGWRHLYLIDAKEGGIKNQITQGECVVRGIDRIDEEKRQIWFRASGKNADQDPYFIHYYRVNFDGTGLVALTEGNGNHTVQFSPDRKYLIDTYSRVDMPPVHELRRARRRQAGLQAGRGGHRGAEGTRGWEPPEVFRRQGPRRQDRHLGHHLPAAQLRSRARSIRSSRSIYAGPQGSFVPKTFSGGNRYASLADLGFIVVQIDGMGTANRSKAFHDVCWHNLKDAGFPDRILWIKAAAEKYPYDGHSAASASTAARPAGRTRPAACCSTPSSTRPPSPAAAATTTAWTRPRGTSSGWATRSARNTRSARTSTTPTGSQGKLMLIVGELDDNVPPDRRYRLADALIKAGKDFDFVVVPGAGHGMGGEYGIAPDAGLLRPPPAARSRPTATRPTANRLQELSPTRLPKPARRRTRDNSFAARGNRVTMQYWPPGFTAREHFTWRSKFSTVAR